MEAIIAVLLGIACLISPLVVIFIAIVMEAVGGDDQDRADLERIRRGGPDRWARPGVPSSSDAPCHGCAVGIHASCDGDCDCDCPWPFITPRRATIGR